MRLNNLEFVKSYLVVKAFLLNQINKAHPIGHVSHRSTGDWKKVSANQWVKVKRKGEKEDTGAAIPKKSVDLSNEKERYNFAKGLAEDYEAGKLPDKLNKLIDAEKGELLGEDTIADAISNLLESKENKSATGISIFDSPEFVQWAEKKGLKIEDKEQNKKIEYASKFLKTKELNSLGDINKFEKLSEDLQKLKKEIDIEADKHPDKITSISEKNQNRLNEIKTEARKYIPGIDKTIGILKKIGFDIKNLDDVKEIAKKIKEYKKSEKEKLSDKSITPQEKEQIKNAEKQLIRFEQIRDEALSRKHKFEQENGRKMEIDEAKKLNDELLTPDIKKEYKDFYNNVDLIELLRKKYAKNDREKMSLGFRDIWERHKNKLLKEHGKPKGMQKNKEDILKYESAKEELNNLTKKLDKQIKTQLPNTETAQLRKKWNDARINYREKLLKAYPTKEKWNDANPDKTKEENNQYYDEQIVKMLSRLKKLKSENKI